MYEERNTFAVTLLEATITLYAADPSGAPILNSPIWSGVQAENVAVRERWIKVETRPSGAFYPRKHPLIPQLEISLGRVWALDMVTQIGFTTFQGFYVLDVVWLDEDTGFWHRETFYNVTISERSRTSRGIDDGFTDEQVFDAEYAAPPTGGFIPPSTGGIALVPAITGGLPLGGGYVALDGSSSSLYSYDVASHNFTELSAGISSGKVTLAYVPDQSGIFTVTFAGSQYPALTLESDGTVLVSAIIQGAPGPTNIPRYDFFYGQTRVASITQSGVLYAASFTQATPTPGDAEFQIFSNNTLGMVLAGVGVTALDFQTS